jgi:hypothetical protein
MPAPDLTRRGLLDGAAATGAAALVAPALTAAGPAAAGEPQPDHLAASVRVGPEGLATIRLGAAAADGSGGLAWTTVGTPRTATLRVATAPGSRWLCQQEACRTARELLVALAARRWAVPAAECRAALGRISHGASGRRVGYTIWTEPA